MDLNKIGKFIQRKERRKIIRRSNLQIFLILVTEQFPNGNAAKDFRKFSLLQPLCKTLGISVNELLTGERLDKENYMKKAEQKMVHLVEEKKENRTKLILILLMGLISIISFVTLIVVVNTYAEVISNQAKGILVFIACAVFSVGLLALMEGERTFGYYKCLHCEETFVPGFINYTIGLIGLAIADQGNRSSRKLRSLSSI